MYSVICLYFNKELCWHVEHVTDYHELHGSKMLELDLDVRKSVFDGLRITQGQTSLHIRTVWSAPLLFAFWKVSYLGLLQVKFQISG